MCHGQALREVAQICKLAQSKEVVSFLLSVSTSFIQPIRPHREKFVLQSVILFHFLLNSCERKGKAKESRVTHHVVQNTPLTSNKSSALASGQARPKRNFYLKSTGYFGQHDVSPCIYSDSSFDPSDEIYCSLNTKESE